MGTLNLWPNLPKPVWLTRQSPSEEIESIIREIADQPLVAIDTETTGLDLIADYPVYWSLAHNERRFCLKADLLPAFKHVLQDERKSWVLANAKFDAHMLANAGIHLGGNWLDVAVMHALLYEEISHALKEMCGQILGLTWKSFKETFKTKPVIDPVTNTSRPEEIFETLMRYEREDLTSLVEYSSLDAYGTLSLYKKLKEELERDRVHSLYPELYETMWDIFYKTEVPFTKVLWTCERNGITIDPNYLGALETQVAVQLTHLEKEFEAERWRTLKSIGYDPVRDPMMFKPMNINSKHQQKHLFFEVLKIQPISFTKGGKSGIPQPQMDDDVLQALKHKHPLAGILCKYAELRTLQRNYIIGLPKHLSSDGRIHPRFNQDVARTGRLSSSNPNCQNIPNPEKDKWKVRRAFIARKGYKLICFDYEALEMRLLAAAAMEEDMINIFLRGEDIHIGNASMVFDLPYADIKAAKKKEEKDRTEYDNVCVTARGDIKAVGFG